MATCPLTAGYTAGDNCEGLPAGVAWIAFVESYNKDTITIAAGVVTAMVLQSTKVFRKYTPRKNTAFFTDNLTKDAVSGGYSYKSSIQLSLFAMTTTLRLEVLLLARNYLVAIVMGNDGVARLFGYYNYLDVVTVDAGSGTTFGDGTNKQVLTLNGEWSLPAYEVNAATLTSLGL